MRRPFLLAFLAVVLVAAGLLVWPTGEANREGLRASSLERRIEADRGTPPPRLHGVEAAAAAAAEAGGAAVPVPAVTAVSGVVVDGRGDPVAGATVYLLRKGERAFVEPAHVQTDADGRFSLWVHETARHWLGVLAHGFLPRHVDGDALAPEEMLRLTVEEGPGITVRVEGVDGGPLALGTHVEIVSGSPSTRPWPAPGEAWAFGREFDLPPGLQERRVRLGTAGPVEVEARYGNAWWIVDPERPVLASPGDTVVFRITPSCVLDFHVLDAATGEGLPRGFQYAMLADGEETVGGAMILPGGRLRLNIQVRPRTYVLRVWATGYRKTDSEPVHLTRPGQEAVVRVALERDPTMGNLRISLPVLAGLPRQTDVEGTSHAPGAFCLWRRDGWGALQGESRRESDTDYFFEGVPEGEVSLLVGECVSGRVALVTGIRVRGRATETRTIDLLPGIRFRLADVLADGEQCRSLRVRHPLYGELPTWSFEPATAYWIDAGDKPPAGPPIGPYPGPSLDVEVVLEDGTAKTVHLE